MDDIFTELNLETLAAVFRRQIIVPSIVQSMSNEKIERLDATAIGERNESVLSILGVLGRSLKVVVFSVTPFKIDQYKKSKSFNRLSPESGNRKKVDMQRLSPIFRSQQFFLWEICGETFFPNL